MVFDILRKLELEGTLGRCHLTLRDSRKPGGTRIILGSELTRVSRERIELLGGESLYEAFRIPLESIQEIRLEGRPVFRRRSSIKRIHMRK